MEQIVIEDCGTLPQLTRIQLPCFMRDKSQFLKALGGEDVVLDSLQEEAQLLHATLSPQDDPPRYSFKSKPVLSNGFLIRVRRKKKKGKSEVKETNEASVSESVQATVVGYVGKSYKFDIPVGCQFLRVNNSEEGTQHSDEKIHLEVAPHPFPGRYDCSHFDVFAAKCNEPNAAPREKTRNYIVSHVKFGEGMEIPKDDISDKEMRQYIARLRKVEQRKVLELVKFLRQVLQENLMLTRAALLPKLEEYYSGELPRNLDLIFKQLLPLLSYLFVGGPWSRCWTRKGFDPTTEDNSHARFLQVLQCRFSTTDYSNLTRCLSMDRATGKRVIDLDLLEYVQHKPKIYAADVSGIIMVAFGGMQITKQFCIQLRHFINIPDFEHWRDLPHLKNGMSANGWFEENQLSTMRLHVKEYIVKKVTAFCDKQQPLNVANYSVTPAVLTMPFKKSKRLRKSRSDVQKRHKDTPGHVLHTSAAEEETRQESNRREQESLTILSSLDAVDEFDVFHEDEMGESEGEDDHMSNLYEYDITEYEEI